MADVADSILKDMTFENEAAKVHMLLAANGGIEQSAWNLAKYYASEGYTLQYDMLVEETLPYQPLVDAGVMVNSYANKLTFLNKFGKIGRNLRFALLVALWYLKERPGRALIWSKELTLIAILLKFLCPGCYIISSCVIHTSRHLQTHPTLKLRILTTLYQIFLKKSNRLIACSESVRDDLIELYNIPEDKIRCIYPPLKQEFIDYTTAEKKYGSKTVLYAGRLAKVKNLTDLLAAMTKVIEAVPEANLVLAGDGNCEEELKEKVAELLLQDKVTFAGLQEDMLPFYEKADVFALSSHYEGFGMVLAEATICGVPVVSYNCPAGPAEIIVHGKNGYLVEQYNIQELADRIIEALNRTWQAEDIRSHSIKYTPEVSFRQFTRELNRA